MKKSFAITIVLLFLYIHTQAQQPKALAYIEKYKDVAIAEMQRSGVPAAITLAQGMLESGYGESELCKQSNNHFGIKCKTEWTGDKVYHDDDTKNECFRVYPDAAASYKDHSDFLKSRDWYAPLFKLSPMDVEGWAYGLKKAGYATEKDYPQRLLKLINDYNLNQYTIAALQSTNTNNIAASKNITIPDTNQSTQNFTFNVTAPSKDTVDEEESEIIVLSKPNHNQQNKVAVQAASVNYPEGIFTINHSKVMYAHAGTSLIMLALEHHIDLAKLIEFNELNESDILQNNELIFLERKQKKGEKDFHIIEADETLHDICQKEGVRMDYILVYNNLNKDSHLITGNKIYLRATAPVNSQTTVTLLNNPAVKNSL